MKKYGLKILQDGKKGPPSLSKKLLYLYENGWRVMKHADPKCKDSKWGWVKLKKGQGVYGGYVKKGCICHHTPIVRKDGTIEEV